MNLGDFTVLVAVVSGVLVVGGAGMTVRSRHRAPRWERTGAPPVRSDEVATAPTLRVVSARPLELSELEGADRRVLSVADLPAPPLGVVPRAQRRPGGVFGRDGGGPSRR